MEEILMLYHEINNIYLELYNLELNGSMEDNSFLELVNLLKDKVDEEMELYKNLNNSLDEDEFDYLYNFNKTVDNLFAERITSYMKFYDNLDKNRNINYVKLYIACTRNIYLIYLSFLQEYINLKSFSLERKGLLNYKYCNSFINHGVEEQLILNNFNVNKVNYINLFMIYGMIKLEYEEIDKIIFDFLYDTIIITIINLLFIIDIEYENDLNRKIISINNQCMLRAALSLYSESEFSCVENKIYNIIDDLSDNSNRISREIINSILKYRKKDRSRVRKLSLIPVED